MTDQTTEPNASVETNLHAFLSGLYRATEDDFRLFYGDETVDAGDDLGPLVTAAGAEPIYVSMVTGGGDVPFLYERTNYAAEDAWAELIGPQATAALYRQNDLGEGTLVCVFALAEAARAEDPALISLSKAMGCDVTDTATDFIATPGANDWRLVHFDPSIVTPIADLVTAYTDGPAAPVAIELDDSLPDHGLLEHATVRTPLDLSDPFFDETVTESFAGGSRASNWKTLHRTRGEVLKTFCRHTVQAEKDGPASVLGATNGKRGADDIEELWFVGLDIDNGFDGDTIARRIIDAGLTAVLASTHSHMTTSTEKSLAFFEDWAAANAAGQVLDDVVMKAAMLDQGLEAAIVETLTFERREVRQAGKMKVKVFMTHAPIPKWRVIVPLDSAFVVAENGETQQDGAEAWRAVPRALAAMLGDLPIDSTGCDVNRLFYHPAHRQGSPWRIDVFGGQPLDWRQALKDYGGDAAEATPSKRRAAGALKGAVHNGPFDARWAKKNGTKLMIADMMVAVDKRQQEEAQAAGTRLSAKDRLITSKADVEKKVLIRCPFEDGHSKAVVRPTGTFVQNPGVSEKAEGFVFYCGHDHCLGKSRTDFLNKMLADQTITAEDVQRHCEMMVDEPEEDDFAAVEADLVALLGIATPAAETAVTAVSKPGAVAVNGVLDGLDQWNPKKTLFTGPNAADEAIDALGKVASVVKMGNKMKVVIRGKDGLGFFSEAEARLFFKPYKAEIEVGLDKNGDPMMKDVPAIDLLLASERRVAWEGIDCDPSNSLPSHVLNTWSGIEIAPAPGGCNLLKAHIRNSLCSGDAGYDHYLTQWFAHMVQKPTQKPGVAPVVIGPKGSGKSTVADFVRRAIGKKHSVKIAQAKHLVGNFNAHLAGMLFCQAEEVTFGGDRKSEGPLKDMITAKTMLAEKKGLDAYQETNFTRFFLVSNDGHVVHASDGERRWFVLRATDLFAGRPMNDPDRIAYFDALNAEADAGGIAAFLDYLLAYDLTGFTPFAAPDTDALSDQKEQGLSDDDQWVLGVLQTGAFDDKDGVELGETWELDEPLEIDQSVVRSSYASHVKRYGGSSGGANAALKALARHGDVKEVRKGARSARKRLYRFAPRQEWRDAFEKRFGIGFAAEMDGDD